jgi:hypothetical protein
MAIKRSIGKFNIIDSKEYVKTSPSSKTQLKAWHLSHPKDGATLNIVISL